MTSSPGAPDEQELAEERFDDESPSVPPEPEDRAEPLAPLTPGEEEEPPLPDDELPKEDYPPATPEPAP